MAEISWTAEAQRWLEDIFEYITNENPRAARETVNGIYEPTQRAPAPGPGGLSIVKIARPAGPGVPQM